MGFEGFLCSKNDHSEFLGKLTGRILPIGSMKRCELHLIHFSEMA
jgi:hypothetical protein